MQTLTFFVFFVLLIKENDHKFSLFIWGFPFENLTSKVGTFLVSFLGENPITVLSYVIWQKILRKYCWNLFLFMKWNFKDCQLGPLPTTYIAQATRLCRCPYSWSKARLILSNWPKSKMAHLFISLFLGGGRLAYFSRMKRLSWTR